MSLQVLSKNNVKNLRRCLTIVQIMKILQIVIHLSAKTTIAQSSIHQEITKTQKILPNFAKSLNALNSNVRIPKLRLIVRNLKLRATSVLNGILHASQLKKLATEKEIALM